MVPDSTLLDPEKPVKLIAIGLLTDRMVASLRDPTDDANYYSGRRCSLEAFLKSCSPDVHVAGRISFHLVENRKGSAPFANSCWRVMPPTF